MDMLQQELTLSVVVQNLVDLARGAYTLQYKVQVDKIMVLINKL